MSQRLQSSFQANATALDVIANHELGDRTVLITGAASGIGIETARAFAKAGATVIMGVRDRDKGESVAEEIRRETRHSQIHVGPLDLIDQTSVRRFAAAVSANFTRLDILINNAGVMGTPLARSAEGYESQFATNHLGHFLLTMLLVPLLEKAAPARVVSLTSTGHTLSPVVFDDIDFTIRSYDRSLAYGQSKTANSLFAVGLTRHLSGRGITANAVMPGAIMTGLQRHMTLTEMRAMGWINADGSVNAAFKTPAQGAATTVWAATGAELAGIGGLYLENLQQAEPWHQDAPWRGVKDYALCEDAAQQLWQVSEQRVNARVKM